MGPIDNVEGALDYWEDKLRRFEAYRERALARAEEKKQRMPPAFIQNGEVLPDDKHRRADRWNFQAKYWQDIESAKRLEKVTEEMRQRIDKIRAVTKQ